MPVSMDEEAPAPEAPSSCNKLSKRGLGVVLILLVAVIWVAASEWIQWIFGDLHYDKPYFLTFFNTAGFCFWNFGFLTPSWRRVPWRNDDESGERIKLSGNGGDVQVYSIVELLRCAALFCPLWFLANSLFNYSLDTTSVASNTILSSTSTVWTLLLSRIVLSQAVTPVKLVSVLLSVGGSVLVALADDRHGSSASSLVGDGIALLSAFFYATYTTVLKWCLPDEERYRMGMVFGFVGILNLIMMWPGLVLVDLLSVETFELPPLNVFWALAVNALVGTNLSDVLWAKSVILTSPLVATLGLSLTTPLAMVADFVLRGRHFSAGYVCGALLVVAGFVCSSIPTAAGDSADETGGNASVVGVNRSADEEPPRPNGVT